jgi:hypothetical protein
MTTAIPVENSFCVLLSQSDTAVRVNLSGFPKFAGDIEAVPDIVKRNKTQDVIQQFSRETFHHASCVSGEVV